MLAQKIRKARDHCLMAARSDDYRASVCPGAVHVLHKPVRRFRRERLEAANACGGRQIRQRPRRADIGGDRRTQHARDGVADFRRTLGRLHPAYVRDRAFQTARGGLDRGLLGSTQVEPTSCAKMLRDKLAQVEGSDAGVARWASIAKATALHEARHTRCQPALPPEVRCQAAAWHFDLETGRYRFWPKH
ncbi:hypothetical protein ACG873_03385 [Mesorhizobium sp. AaZ16]|uniref:hypothetical protein n=1 Tax=Mesorhizobium sp. AaZ16 TaxID=3402289 RepID=UPI00374E6512